MNTFIPYLIKNYERIQAKYQYIIMNNQFFIIHYSLFINQKSPFQQKPKWGHVFCMMS